MNFLSLPACTWATPVIELKSIYGPQIAIDRDGNIIEISIANQSTNRVVEATTYRHSTNSWSKPIVLSALDMNASNIRLTVDPDGNAAAIWQITDGQHEKIQTALYTSSEDIWSSTSDISEMEQNIVVTHVAMAETGNIFVAWKKSNNHLGGLKTVTFTRGRDKAAKTILQIPIQ